MYFDLSKYLRRPLESNFTVRYAIRADGQYTHWTTDSNGVIRVGWTSVICVIGTDSDKRSLSGRSNLVGGRLREQDREGVKPFTRKRSGIINILQVYLLWGKVAVGSSCSVTEVHNLSVKTKEMP